MTETNTAAALTLTALVTRAMGSAQGETTMGGLTMEFLDAAIGGLCLLVSGEGSALTAEIATLAAHWSSLFGDAVRTSTDSCEDYDGDQYTCLWLNMETAIANLGG